MLLGADKPLLLLPNEEEEEELADEDLDNLVSKQILCFHKDFLLQEMYSCMLLHPP